jgi:hypothetical protein
VILNGNRSRRSAVRIQLSRAVHDGPARRGCADLRRALVLHSSDAGSMTVGCGRCPTVRRYGHLNRTITSARLWPISDSDRTGGLG